MITTVTNVPWTCPLHACLEDLEARVSKGAEGVDQGIMATSIEVTGCSPRRRRVRTVEHLGESSELLHLLDGKASLLNGCG